MDDRGLGIWAANQLQNRGVKFFTNTPVASMRSNGITLLSGEERRYDVVVNAAGPWAADLISASNIKSKNNIGLMLVRGSHLIIKRELKEAVVGMSGGVVTIYGGKWSTSRQLGRKTADAVEKR